MNEQKIAIIIDANGKTAIGVMDSVTGSVLRTVDATELLTKSADKSGTAADRSAAKWSKAGGLIGTAIGSMITGAAVLIGRQINAADAAGKLAEKLGVSTAFISEMGYVAKSTGSDTRALEAGLFALGDSATKAADGLKKPADAYRALGVDVLDAHGKLKSLDQLLPEVADKFARMEDGPRKAKLAVDLLGGAGRDLLPVLSLGGDGIDELRKKAADLGLTITDETAKGAAEFKDKLDALMDLVTGFANDAIEPLLPMLNTLGDLFLADATATKKAASESNLLTNAFKAMAITTAIVRGAIQALVNILAGAWDIAIAGAQHGASVVTETWTGVWDVIGAAWEGDIDGAIAKFNASSNRLAKISDEGTGKVLETWKNLTGGVSAAADETSRAIADMLDPLQNVADATADAKPPVDDLTGACFGLGDAARGAATDLPELSDAAEELAADAAAMREEMALLEAQLSGPTAVATLDYERQLARINVLQKAGAIDTAEATRWQALLAEQLTTTRGTTAALIADLEFERSLIGLTNVDREVAIQLRQLEAGATDEQRAAVERLIREIYAEGEAHEFAAQKAEEGRRAWGEFSRDMVTAFRGGTDGVKALFADLLEDLLAQMAASGLAATFASMFGGGGGASWGSLFSSFLSSGTGASGGGFNVSSLMSMFGGGGSGGNWMQTLGSFFGLGGSAATTGAALASSSYAIPAATYLGPGSTATYGVGSTATGVSSSSGASAGAGMAGAAAMVAWFAAAIMANMSLYDKGWRPQGGTVTTPWGEEIQGGGRGSGGPGFAGNIVTRIAESVLGRLGLNDRWSSIISGGALVTRAFGHKRPEIEGTGVQFDFGADGVGGDQWADILERGGWFRSDRRSTARGELDAEQLEAIEAFWASISQANVDVVRALGGSTATSVAASFRQTLDADGNITSEIGTILGETYNESWEVFAGRIASENIIANIDAALGTTVAAIGDAISNPIIDGVDDAIGIIDRDRPGNRLIKRLLDDVVGGDHFDDERRGDAFTGTIIGAPGQVGEASAIAERWRDDPAALAAGAQFLLQAAIDMRQGIGLLREEGGLTAVTDLVEELAYSGESLADTYVRLQVSAGMFDQVLALSGLALDRSREAHVRWSADVIEAAGGIDRASALIDDYVSRYFTAAERAQYALSQARTAGQNEFDDIGLNLDDYTGEGGMAALREMFEGLLPTLSAEATVEWLEALSMLGLVIDATDALAVAEGNLAEQTQEQLAAVREVLDANAFELAAAGMTSAARAAAEINQAYDEQRQQLLDNAATVEQLAELEAQRTQALEQQRAAMQAEIQELLGANAFELAAAGMTEAERAAAEINRTYDEQRRQLIDLGASELQLLQLELQRTTALDQQATAMRNNIEALLSDLAFGLNIDGLSEVELAQARVNAEYDDYRETLIQQGATTEQLTRLEELRTAALEDATEALGNATVSIGQIHAALGVFVEGLRAQVAQFTGAGMRAWIEGLTGFTPQEAQALVRLDDTRETVRDAYNQQIATLTADIAIAQARLANTPWFAQADRRLIEGQIAALRDTLRQVTNGFGDAIDYVDDLFGQQLDSLLGGLRDEFGANDPIADINERFDSLRDQATAWGATEAQLAEIEAYRQQALLGLIEDRYESEMDFLRRLVDFRDSLLLDENLSILTPEERLAEARQQYEETLAAARAGDATAQANFEDVTRAYLAEMRSYNPETYNEETFRQVLAELDALIAGNGAAQAGAVAGSEAAAAGVAPSTANVPAVQFDVSPVTASLDELRGTVSNGTSAVVNELRALATRVGQVETATRQQTAAIEVGNNYLRNR